MSSSSYCIELARFPYDASHSTRDPPSPSPQSSMRRHLEPWHLQPEGGGETRLRPPVVSHRPAPDSISFPPSTLNFNLAAAALYRIPTGPSSTFGHTPPGYAAVNHPRFTYLPSERPKPHSFHYPIANNNITVPERPRPPTTLQIAQFSHTRLPPLSRPYMSSTQQTASPHGPRPKHQHSRSATQVPPNNNGKQSQRRQKGNRANNATNGTPQKANNGSYGSPGKPLVNGQDATFADSAVLSSEDVPIPSGPRNKKHTQSQPSADRLFSPTSIQTAALTDSELPVKNPSATPAKQAAYAGPTFHQSPAPSALPIPKFLSRSVPSKAFAGPPTPPHDSSASGSPPTPSPPTPSRAPIAIPERSEQSPGLNMLFRADAAERARKASGSPASVSLSNSPHPSSANNPLYHHAKQSSQSSMNTMFPFELDANSKPSRPSPPVASPDAHRSITAPGRIPQVADAAGSNNDPAVLELLSRLHIKPKDQGASTPPRAANRVPSEPSSRHQTPSPFRDSQSPFRSASGPSTPAAPPQEQSADFHYGNKNLSPLFKAAKNDNSKRNSGLRTEITADSPILPQGGFPPVGPAPRMDPAAVSRGYLGQAFGSPVSPRRGSAPQVQPYGVPQYGPSPQPGSPNNPRMRTPGKRSYHPRPDSYPHGQTHSHTHPHTHPHTHQNGPVKPTPTPPAMNPFIPSSVQAKKFAKSATKAADSRSLEEDLKRMLNVSIPGDSTASTS